ncbi:MAG TPA: glucose 1-dehydrogenase [Kofleriaceae bacterium]|jgi:3-oxoacyl-[acyl-carrier protein] reductase
MLKNKVAIVTGSSKGIGAGIAKRFAAEGASVVVNYNSDADGAAKVVASIEQTGGRAIAVRADTSKAAEVERLFAETDRVFGKLDILVNNAGVYSFAPLEGAELATLQHHLAVNVNGPFMTMQAALKRMSKGGVIINISSSAVRLSMAGTATYTASKAALDAISRIVAKEVGARGIRVNTISPGPTMTEGAAKMAVDPEVIKHIIASLPLGRPGDPADIASAAAFLASDQASWITGENLTVAGGQ